MADNKPHDVSEEMYHRVYRLIKRRLNPHVIAATLNLPLRTILGVISRIERNANSSGHVDSIKVPKNDDNENQEYLDIYFYPKTRYAVLELAGSISDSCSEKFRSEIEKILHSSWKAVAIRMHDVVSISESICKIIIEVRKQFLTSGKYIAILDPSPETEKTLIEFNIEATVPVFGTENAFEDAAFLKKGKGFTRRGTQAP